MKNKTFLITGGLGFLGQHFVKHFYLNGANIIIFDVLKKRSANKIINELIDSKKTRKITYFNTDITNKKKLEKIAKLFQEKNIMLDVLINNAALNPKVENNNKANSTNNSFEQLSLESWNKELSVNLTGTMLCCQIFGSKMQSGGSIINIASIYGLVAPDQSIYPKGFTKPITYGVTKAGVINLTKYLASYWGSKNIRVNCVVFGGVENNQDKRFQKKYNSKTPLKRMAVPSDFFGILNYLASNESSYSNGSIYVIDGGWSIL